ncbi:MAG: hypothetical protein QOI66_4576 [Myxococcales bacterium]|jgi:hypothetical protein|nr:hypothetical protein [Myxococcales bacterium]
MAKGMTKAVLISALLGAAAAAGCQGDIGPSMGGGSGAIGGGGTGLGGMGVGGAGPGNKATDPGTVPMHRLNLAEYDNTMRDLLGLAPADAHPSVKFNFPPDDRGTDFDNIAAVLTVAAQHINTYNTAVSSLVPAALANPTQRALLTTCDLATGGAACARTSLAAFLPRAWRRPVTDAEVGNLMALVMLAPAQNDPVETGFALAVQAALLSPNFLFRPEFDPAPDSLTPHAITDYELASRLSYFVWSSMPDDQLFSAAKIGNLHEPATMATQVTRMLADPKARALIDNFAGQWLLIRNIDSVTPDSMLFPNFNSALRASMKSETQMLFQQVAFNNLPADQLISAQFTYLTDPLAQFYGLPAVGSTQPTKVDLAASAHRRGLLSQGLLLTVNSHANITSPVLRGKFVLTNLLCENVPPPPDKVNTNLAPDPTGMLTLRQVLEGHVSNATCAACHSLMDPIGFGLENYSAIGAYRTMDGSLPIDATGTLHGQKFNGESEMAQIIASDPEFSACLANKLFTYALGRTPDLTSPNSMDAPALAAMTDQFKKGGLQFGQLLTSIVSSPSFLSRRGYPGGMQ